MKTIRFKGSVQTQRGGNWLTLKMEAVGNGRSFEVCSKESVGDEVGFNDEISRDELDLATVEKIRALMKACKPGQTLDETTL